MSTISIYIQQYFGAYITAVTNTNTGGFSDRTPPITPDEFNKRLKDEALAPLYTHGTPTPPEDQRAISAATTIYTIAYGDFVKLPLNGDAPPEVVAWQEEARKG